MNPKYLPMNCAALMDRVFDVYKATFKTQIAFSLVVGIISFVFMFLFIIIFGIGVAAVVGMTGYMDEQYLYMMVGIMLIGFLPLYICWMYLSESGHILITKQAFYEELIEFPIKEAVGAFFRVVTAVAAQLILSLPFAAFIFFIIFSFTAGYHNFIQIILYTHPVLLILGSLFFAVFYVIYSNFFSLAVPAAILEKRFFFAAIARSVTLLKGDFWRILGLRLLWRFLVFLFTISAQGFVMMLVTLFTAMAGNVVDFGALMVASGPLQSYATLFVFIIISPMEGIMTALIYFNQKIKKDGLDIEIGVSQLIRGAIR